MYDPYLSFSTDPGHPRYIPELPVRFQKIVLPAMHMVLTGFPDSPQEQRALMPDLDRDVFFENGGLCEYRNAIVSEHIPLTLGSFPKWMEIAVSTCHDIRQPVESLHHGALQISVNLTFSTEVNAFEQLNSNQIFLNMKGVQRFLHETAVAAGLLKGEPNIVYPGKFLASYGARYGDSAYGKTLRIHTQDLPVYRQSVKQLADKMRNAIDLELEELSVPRQ